MRLGAGNQLVGDVVLRGEQVVDGLPRQAGPVGDLFDRSRIEPQLAKCRVVAKGSANSLTVAAPCVSRTSSARRVGSASAAKVEES
jgi:hypothetical protein